MNAHELRIGNWVKNSRRNREVKVGFHTFYMLSEGHLEEDDIHPISLTEKWLNKFGFEDNKFDYFTIEYDDHAGYGLSYSGNFLRGVEYVHQLQNLYFALTGEELVIKQG